MLLHLSTWAEIGQYLERSRTIVIPIGSNEQHGPTGLLGTDWMCPEIIAREAQGNADILIAPTFNIGMAQHHLGFPGTISLRAVPDGLALRVGRHRRIRVEQPERLLGRLARPIALAVGEVGVSQAVPGVGRLGVRVDVDLHDRDGGLRVCRLEGLVAQEVDEGALEDRRLRILLPRGGQRLPRC